MNDEMADRRRSHSGPPRLLVKKLDAQGGGVPDKRRHM
jgi:hypothetical protein